MATQAGGLRWLRAGRRRPAWAPISWSTTAISHAGSRPAAGGFEDCAWAYAAAAQRRTVSRTLSIYHAGGASVLRPWSGRPRLPGRYSYRHASKNVGKDADVAT